MTWVENGVLKNLAYGVTGAMFTGRTYAGWPHSMRFTGGTTTIDQMIAQCADGIYVNRFSGVDLIDRKTCLTTGVTRDGCFYVKDGKIVKPVKNFRFDESPFFMLNKIEALGIPERTSFGYTPKGAYMEGWECNWPRWPMIVPPMMVRDFNFSALADAV
jgi:predicted Zn-dependent protease